MQEVKKDVLWMIYWDESPRLHSGSNQKDLDRVAQFARSCLDAFKESTGMVPTKLGVTSSFPDQAAVQLTEKGVQVIHNLPSWAGSEVWVGAVVDDQTLEF